MVAKQSILVVAVVLVASLVVQAADQKRLHRRANNNQPPQDPLLDLYKAVKDAHNSAMNHVLKQSDQYHSQRLDKFQGDKGGSSSDKDVLCAPAAAQQLARRGDANNDAQSPAALFRSSMKTNTKSNDTFKKDLAMHAKSTHDHFDNTARNLGKSLKKKHGSSSSSDDKPKDK